MPILHAASSFKLLGFN